MIGTGNRVCLIPRGKPDTGASWADPKPRWIIYTEETTTYWRGRPVDNPACPDLTWPKFAWIEVSR